MTNTKNLIDELDGHLRRYMEDRTAPQAPVKGNPHLFRMCVTFEALRSMFNRRYAAMEKASRAN